MGKYEHLNAFRIPMIVLLGTLLYLLLGILGFRSFAVAIVLASVALGTFKMLKQTVITLSKKQFALDYIAILAIAVALVMNEYLVAAILALMVSGGGALEDYGVARAKRSLTALIDRIPADVTLWKGGLASTEKIGNIKPGDEILIRKGEVIPLDGTLLSESGETDESSLTGEPYFIEKVRGDLIRSGTVNIGQPMVIRVTKNEEDSTYKKIIRMVQQAEEEKSPLVRLADRYSMFFTAVTLAIAAFTYAYSNGDMLRVLAVLAVATPCPLIIATPIALLGGVNAAAKRKIIVKKLAALEALSRSHIIVFDKTGTITLGRPKITRIESFSGTEEQALSVSEALERNSLHPLAKAVVNEARRRGVPVLRASGVAETLGSGISGSVAGENYLLSKLPGEGMAIALFHGTKRVAVFRFEDEIKEQSKETLREFEKSMALHIFTGDKKGAAEKVLANLGTKIEIRAECTPEDKQRGIEELKKRAVVAMVGDGINDAPALALADVGMAFSNEEQTASSEAADIVFLGGDFSMVLEVWKISKRTMAIAQQSIIAGIGLSIGAMMFASLGFISPIAGAGLQEVIDILTIINALRASR